jgi:acyl-CoA thioester hydrolase
MGMGDTFKVRRRVEFADTDMAGIVHFSNFFRMMEAAEHAFLRSLGVTVHGSTSGEGTGWPRVKASCEYLRPLRFEDWVEIELWVGEVRNRSVRYEFELKKVGGATEGVEAFEVVARGQMVAVYVRLNADQGLKAEPVPEALREGLVRFLGERRGSE